MPAEITPADQPLTRRGLAIYRSLWFILMVYFRMFHRLKVVGSENIPADGAFVLALGAHRSILDTPLAAMTSKRLLRYMGGEAYFNIPVFGSFLLLVGGFPVERDVTDRQALRLSEDLLKAGYPLVIFPEATRGSGDFVGDVREGTAFIASRAGVPIVPVGIGGTERALGIGRNVPRPTKLSLVVGTPIEPPVAVDGGRIKRSQVNEFSETVKQEMQNLFNQAQSLVGQTVKR
jgi:1-acyl-sn-glycerol-3-phosphate acyltransferase